jgi:predicted amidohydrolase YtcJ
VANDWEDSMINTDAPGRILYSGTILTMEPDAPRAEAVVTDGDSILFVGGRDEAVAAAGPDAQVVQLGDGEVLLPGFIDGHGHVGLVTLFDTFVDLTPTPVGEIASIDQMVTRLSQVVSDGLPEHGWVLGCNYDDSLMAEHRHPTRHDLDRVSLEHPIVVVHASGHLAAVNSKAMQVVGIDENTADPQGGTLRREPGTSEPNGVLEEHAWMDLVAPHLPRPPVAEAMVSLTNAQKKYAAQGFTTVQEGFTDPMMLALLTGASGADALWLDLVSYVAWPTVDQALQGREPDDGYVGRLRIGGIKMVLDGSPQGMTAWLTEPYLMPPKGMPADYRGYPALPDDEVSSLLTSFHRKGWPVLAHCNGDATADQFIAAVTAARAEDTEADPTDFVMIHAQTVREDQLDSMKELGITPSFFITHVYYWGDWHRDHVLGLPRAARISPLRSATDRGIRFSLHNDSPVAPIWSMILVATAVNRLTLTDQELGPEQRIDAEQALRAMTIDGAFQYGESDRKGSLRAGKQADLVVLSADPLSVDPTQLADITVQRTVSRGRTVFEAE